MVRAKHPEVGLWSPGRFADKDLVLFFEHIPKHERPAATPVIRSKLEAYSDEPSDDGWTVKGFLNRVNELGLVKSSRAPPRPPIGVGQGRVDLKATEMTGDMTGKL
jgi:hypothetical protein